MIKIILTNDVQKLGRKGEVKQVKEGYFRNFLWPKSLAIAATPAMIKRLEAQRDVEKKREEERREELQRAKNAISRLKLSFSRSVTKTGKLYGGLSAETINKELKNKLGTEVAKMLKPELKEPIKTTGKHKIKVLAEDGTQQELLIEVNKK